MKTYDLNLLRVLDALLATNSVTAAAQRLNLSVPATSHALARLREAAGDPLLVRAGRRLVPTPHAQALHGPVARWIAESSFLTVDPAAGDLATQARVFVVRAPDGIAIAFGATLATAMGKAMPLAQLHFVHESVDDTSALREGRIDLDLGNFSPRDPEIRLVELFRQSQVAMVRQGHALAQGTLTALRYASQAHVAVQRRPNAPSLVDEALAAVGLARRVAVTVAHANAAPIIAAGSDLVATVSDRMAQAMAPALDLRILKLPFVSAAEPLVMAWHPRQTADLAHTWLRDEIQAVVRALRTNRRSAAAADTATSVARAGASSHRAQ